MIKEELFRMPSLKMRDVFVYILLRGLFDYEVAIPKEVRFPTERFVDVVPSRFVVDSVGLREDT